MRLRVMPGAVRSVKRNMAVPQTRLRALVPRGARRLPCQASPHARILIMATDGFEESELFGPRAILRERGADGAAGVAVA